MTVLLTGVAGFIGMHVAEALLARGEAVLGIDSLNAYYDVRLKEARLGRLDGRPGFRFARLDIAEPGTVAAAIAGDGAVDRIVHLAAQAGVRYSIENPGAYVTANLVGHANVLEAARALGPKLRHLVYASSSSVYGGNTKLPFSVDDPVDRPVSLYAATKKADELMSHAYAHMYGVAATGLRFFTVYGPWGRPDMSAWIFAERILTGRPIPVFNRGDMRRDFTWIGDIVTGVLAALDRPPRAGTGAPHRLYNLGNHRSEELLRFIGLIEQAVGRKAELELLPMQPGDVQATYADIDASTADLGFVPKTTIDAGILVFVEWLRGWLGG
ncbi:MAG: NAD-dependent epimerase/dehydratase family protein [Alphaproteobacteria bacterium]|nr:NAD-dependent epimerase/dehydratase family protein [Alphaproteobacteria bacterium]